MPLTVEKSKELFSEAYVRAVVSAAGMHVEGRDVDYDSIDGVITFTGPLGQLYSPEVAFQLKCTSVARHIRPTHISLPLSIKNYDDLRRENVGVPRILIAVIVPSDLATWIVQDDDALRMHRCGYWVSLRGAPDVTNTKRKSVEIPRTQPLTVEAVNQMMARVGNGGLP